MEIYELLKEQREDILQIAAKHGAVRFLGSVARGEADADSSEACGFFDRFRRTSQSLVSS